MEGLRPTKLEAGYERLQETPVTIFAHAANAILEETKQFGLLTTVADDFMKKISDLPS